MERLGFYLQNLDHLVCDGHYPYDGDNKPNGTASHAERGVLPIGSEKSNENGCRKTNNSR
jgi:hypothetical protein